MSGTRKKNYHALYRYLVQYLIDHQGALPDRAEVIKRFKVSSASHLKYILNALAKEGLVIVGRTWYELKIVGSQYVPPARWQEIDEANEAGEGTANDNQSAGGVV